MLHEKLARLLWSLLVLYAEGSILLITLWQVSWTESWEGGWSDTVGLEHFYDNSSSESGEYRIDGFALVWGVRWHLVILLLAILQQMIFDVRRRHDAYNSLLTVSTEHPMGRMAERYVKTARCCSSDNDAV